LTKTESKSSRTTPDIAGFWSKVEGKKRRKRSMTNREFLNYMPI